MCFREDTKFLSSKYNQPNRYSWLGMQFCDAILETLQKQKTSFVQNCSGFSLVLGF